MSVAQSCPTLCDPMDCSPPGSSVCEIFHARILEWFAISFSRGSSQPSDRTRVSCSAGRFFTDWATREAHPSWKHTGSPDEHNKLINSPTNYSFQSDSPTWISFNIPSWFWEYYPVYLVLIGIFLDYQRMSLDWFSCVLLPPCQKCKGNYEMWFRYNKKIKSAMEQTI